MSHKKSKALSTLALAAALICVAGAHAQSSDAYNPSTYLLPSLSALKPDSEWPASKTGWGGGVKLGMPLSPNWDLQFGVNHASSKENSSRYSQTLLGADALYLFSPSGVRPFLLAGLGAERDKTDITAGGRSKTSPFLNIGAGLQYRWSPTLGLQADVRHVYGFLHDQADFGFKRSGNTYFNVGLIWAFGGAPAAAAPMAAAVAAPPPPPPPSAPVRVAPAREPPAPAPAPRVEKFTLQASELFAFDQAELKAPQPKLDEVASVLKANPGIRNLVITGHTDRLGAPAHNQKLSEARAQTVKRYLVGKGVAAERLQAVGKGASQPVATCKNTPKRAELIKCLEPNRRVEVEPVSYEKTVK